MYPDIVTLTIQDALGNLDVLLELEPRVSTLLAISAEKGTGLEHLRDRCFQALDIVRIYTKLPGKHPDLDAPFTLPGGSTVVDMARTVHRDMAAELRYARVWGSAKFDGQSVQMDHILQDRDIIELHV